MEDHSRVFILSDVHRRIASDAFFLLRLRAMWPEADVRFFHDAKAFSRALSKPPDLIISDLTSGDLTITVLEKTLRERSLSVPVLVVVPKSEELRGVQAVREGADDYVLDEPVERFDITVRNLLKRAEIERERAQAAERLSASEEGF
jgi:PleD family two-component response regulator